MEVREQCKPTLRGRVIDQLTSLVTSEEKEREGLVQRLSNAGGLLSYKYSVDVPCKPSFVRQTGKCWTYVAREASYARMFSASG
jgi:hypothetical protein